MSNNKLACENEELIYGNFKNLLIHSLLKKIINNYINY